MLQPGAATGCHVVEAMAVLLEHVLQVLSWQHDDQQCAACRMDEVDVNVAVFTNILADKVEEYGGNDAYMEAQSKLLSKLTDEKTQCLVMNLDGEITQSVS